jgi:hypothetical protein
MLERWPYADLVFSLFVVEIIKRFKYQESSNYHETSKDSAEWTILMRQEIESLHSETAKGPKDC